MSVSYDSTLVLQRVSFAVGEGDIVAVLGPSGCGKTTLLKAILGLVPHEGKIEMSNGSVGYMPQRDTLFDWMNVVDNAALPLRLKGTKKSEARGKALHHLERVGLSDWAFERVYHLSGGMRQRLALARALVSNSKLLLMDEPFASVDAQTRRRLQLYFSQFLHVEGITTLLVTHSVEEAVFLSDEVVLLSSRPARVRATFKVELPKPRTLHVFRDPQYQTMVEEILRQVLAFGT